MNLDPIVHEYDLRCSAEQAFDVYAYRIAEWWHPDYTANPETLESVIIEPRVGGRVLATRTVEGDFTWGSVTVWEPARRLVYTSTLAQSSAHPSEINVRFHPHEDGCQVHFEHGGWNHSNVSDRGKFSDWPLILDRYAALADRVATSRATQQR
jgi:Activator of Hsp90 ATPase homolog 1-like protein